MAIDEDKDNDKAVQCRACLKNDGRVDIFTLDGKYSYSDMMLVCTAVFVRKEDVAKSTCICDPCLERLKEAFAFRALCQRSERLLNRSIKIKTENGDPLNTTIKIENDDSWDVEPACDEDDPQPLEYFVEPEEALEGDPLIQQQYSLDHMKEEEEEETHGVTILEYSEPSESEEEQKVVKRAPPRKYKVKRKPVKRVKSKSTILVQEKVAKGENALKKAKMIVTCKVNSFKTKDDTIASKTTGEIQTKNESSDDAEYKPYKPIKKPVVNPKDSQIVKMIRKNIIKDDVRRKDALDSIMTAKTRSLITFAAAKRPHCPYSEYTVKLVDAEVPEGAIGAEYRVIDVMEYPRLDKKFSRSQLLQLIKSGTLGKKMDKAGAISEFTMNSDEYDGDDKLFIIHKIKEYGEALTQIVRFIVLHWEDAITPVVQKLVYMKKFFKYNVGAGTRNRLVKSHRIATVQGDRLNIKRNRPTYGPRKRYDRAQLCEVCGKVIMGMAKHMRTHTGERPYKCNICTESFIGYTDAQLHIAKHLGLPKKFKCEVCSKSFNSNQNLKAHMEAHTDERPIACETCGKAFKSMRYVKFHQRTHQKDNKFICDYCDRIFHHREDIYKHIKMNHLTVQVTEPCPYCSKEVKVRYMPYHLKTCYYQDPMDAFRDPPEQMNMKSHLSQTSPQHDREFFVCAICGISYDMEAQFMEHVASHM